MDTYELERRQLSTPFFFLFFVWRVEKGKGMTGGVGCCNVAEGGGDGQCDGAAGVLTADYRRGGADQPNDENPRRRQRYDQRSVPMG